MSFFYGDIKSDELKTANGLELQGGANNAYTITLDTRSNIATNYQLNLPSTLGTADQVLKILDINGSEANLGFGTVSGGGTVKLDDIDTGDAFSNLATTVGDIYLYSKAGNVLINTPTSGKTITSRINSIDRLKVYGNGANVTGTLNADGSVDTPTINASTQVNVGPNDNLVLLGSAVGQSISSATTSANIDFKLNTSNTVLKLDGTSNSVLAPYDVKIGGKLYLGAGLNELEISELTDNITIKNTISDADITFNVNDGGSAKDILVLDASENRVNVTNFNTGNSFSLAQKSETINSNSSTSLDFGLSSDFILDITGSYTLTLTKPSNITRVGQQGSIIIKTPSSGTASLSWATSNGWYFPSGIAPTLSVGNNIYDVFSYLIVDATVSNEKILIMDSTNFQAY